ncbi:MAG: cobyric acid synthase CobQ, partial [Chloroflexota bacterium]
KGLGLLPTATEFLTEKSTYQIEATLTGDVAWLATINGQEITGYEIHMGQTTSNSHWLEINREHSESNADGAMRPDGRVWGCYVHGLFANDHFRRAWLSSLGWQDTGHDAMSLERAFDNLADVVEAHLDMTQLESIIGL